MRKRILLVVGVIGCLALVAVVAAIWFTAALPFGQGGGNTTVGKTGVQYVTFGSDRSERRVGLVIWTDNIGPCGDSAESTLFNSSIKGFFSSVDGKRIEWKWKTTKEMGGDFQINGASFDLAKGTLFLVSTKGGQVRVSQLDVDLPKLRDGGFGDTKPVFETFAKDEPSVAKFIAEASEQK